MTEHVWQVAFPAATTQFKPDGANGAILRGGRLSARSMSKC